MAMLIIDLSNHELNFIRSAIEDKYQRLIDSLNISEQLALEREELWEKSFDIEKEEFTYKPAVKPHPYGYRKDGTPRKKTGRPLKKDLK